MDDFNQTNDSSEESTTVLTADMLGESFSDNTEKLTSDMKKDFQDSKERATKQIQQNKAQLMNQLPPQGQMPPQMSPQTKVIKPQGQIPPQNQLPPQMAPQTNGMPPQQMPPLQNNKQAKNQKVKNTEKKSGGGSHAYTIISLILIAGLIGTGVWGFLHFNGKINSLEDEKKQLSDELEVYRGNAADLEDEKADFETQLADKDSEIAGLDEQLSYYQTQTEELTNIFNYINTYCAPLGYQDFIVSDNSFNLKVGDEVEFTIYVKNPDDGLYFEQDNSDIAWAEGISDAYDGNSSIKAYKLHAVQAGSTSMTIYTTTSNQAITININVSE